MNTDGKIIYAPALSVKKDDYLMIKGFPCKITDVAISKTGKHGGCKCHFVGNDIFTNKKYVALHGSGDSLEVPIITKKEYKLCDITKEEDKNGDTVFECSLMDSNGILTAMTLRDAELASKILEAIEKDIISVTVLKALNAEQIMSYRIEK